MAAKLSSASGRWSLRQNAAINVTPLVGVMLLLLIVFMIAAPFTTRAHHIDSLTGHGSEPPAHPPVFINVEQGGALYLGAKATSMERLVTDVGAALGPNRSDEYIMVRADRHVPYGDFMAVMNTLKKGGYRNVDLIIEDL